MAETRLTQSISDRNENYSPITYIYGLRDPSTGLIRYVGKSDNPSRRYHSHLGAHSLSEDTHRSRWLLKLKEQALRPELVTLEAVSAETWAAAEQQWISLMRSYGGKVLTNSKEGGLGGVNPCEETRDRMSERRRAWWASLTEEERKAFSEERSKKQVRGPLKEETRERISQANRSRIHTAQHRENCSIAANKKWASWTEEKRQSNLKRMREGHTAATLKKRADAMRGRPRDGSSPFVGVVLFKRDKNWRAYGRKDGKQVHLGYFTCEIEAARAYNEFAKREYGEFALLNEIP